MFSVTVAVPPGMRLTVGWENVAVSPGGAIRNFALRVTVPENPQMLVMVFVTVAVALPVPVSLRVTLLGLAVMVKSAVHPVTGVGLPVTMKLRS